eukprot:gene5963-6202_t
MAAAAAAAATTWDDHTSSSSDWDTEPAVKNDAETKNDDAFPGGAHQTLGQFSPGRQAAAARFHDPDVHEELPGGVVLSDDELHGDDQDGHDSIEGRPVADQTGGLADVGSTRNSQQLGQLHGPQVHAQLSKQQATAAHAAAVAPLCFQSLSRSRLDQHGAPGSESGRCISAQDPTHATAGETLLVTLPDGDVITPTAFERLAGRDKAKKWRKSIHVVLPDGTTGSSLNCWFKHNPQQGRQQQPQLTLQPMQHIEEQQQQHTPEGSVLLASGGAAALTASSDIVRKQQSSTGMNQPPQNLQGNAKALRRLLAESGHPLDLEWSEGDDSDYSDLEDFIVCEQGTNYEKLCAEVGRRVTWRRGWQNATVTPAGAGVGAARRCGKGLLGVH